MENAKQGDKSHAGNCSVENGLKKSKNRSKKMGYEAKSEIHEREMVLAWTKMAGSEIEEK